jgi:hypothetical protein
MRSFINHLSTDNIYNYLKDEKIDHIDFSLFVDDIPKSQNDLSSINILVIQEPNEYFGIHDWAIANQDLFSFILTWDDKVLNNVPHSIFFPFGNIWITPEQYDKHHDKKFEISHLCGKLLKTYGHSLRHELLARKNEIKIPTNFYDIYGDRYNIDNARKGKEFIFGNSQFGVVIENTSHRGYFTEKVTDCFALKTIPLYWGCSNITDFFNKDGIIKFDNVDDLIYILNNLDENYYHQHLEAVEDNYNKAISFVDYEVRIAKKIKEIFQFNNLI